MIFLLITFMLLSAFALVKLEKSKAGDAQISEGYFVLTVPSLYRAPAFVMIIAGFSFIPIIVFKFGFDTEMLVFAFTIFLITLFLGALVLLYQKNHRVLFNQSHIQVYSMFNVVKQYSWEEIESIKLNHALNMYVAKTTRGTVRFNQHLIGLSALLDFAQNNKGVTV